MADSTGLQFTVKVGALPESTFVVAEFALEEALNRPFNLRLELASAQPDIGRAGPAVRAAGLVQRRAAAPGDLVGMRAGLPGRQPRVLHQATHFEPTHLMPQLPHN